MISDSNLKIYGAQIILDKTSELKSNQVCITEVRLF